MTFLIICILAALVFLSRYLFLEPKLPLKLSVKGERFLHFSAPAVLTAIAAPVVLLPEQAGSESPELWLAWDNPYLIAALFCVVIIRLTGNVLLTTVLGMGGFVLLSQVLLGHGA